MHRVALSVLGTILLIAAFCHGQSLADAARENRKQKAQNGNTAGKVITSDDFSAPPNAIIHLVPGASSTGEGTLVAPGRGKHGYEITQLDATKFIKGGVLHISITLGSGPAEASFDLYSQGSRISTDGFPNSLAGAHNVPSGGTGRIDYRFDHGSVFQFGAEGSWNATAKDTNNYSFVVDVGNH